MEIKKIIKTLDRKIDDILMRFVVSRNEFYPRNYVNSKCKLFMENISWSSLNTNEKTQKIYDELAASDLSLGVVEEYVILLEKAKSGYFQTNSEISDFKSKYRFLEKVPNHIFGLTQKLFEEIFSENSVEIMNEYLDDAKKEASYESDLMPSLYAAKVCAKMIGAEILPSFENKLKEINNYHIQKVKVKLCRQ